MPRSTRRMGTTPFCWMNARYMGVVRSYFDNIGASLDLKEAA